MYTRQPAEMFTLPTKTWIASLNRGSLAYRWLGNYAAFAPDGRSVVSGARDLTVRVWDLTDGRERCFEGHIDNLTTVAFQPDGKTLVSAGHRDVWAWDLTRTA